MWFFFSFLCGVACSRFFLEADAFTWLSFYGVPLYTMASPSVERTTKVEVREKKNDWFENVIRMRDTAEKNSIHKYTQKNIHTLLDHLSLLDMKCNLRKTIFMLMLTLSLGWNVQACASTRQGCHAYWQTYCSRQTCHFITYVISNWFYGIIYS